MNETTANLLRRLGDLEMDAGSLANITRGTGSRVASNHEVGTWLQAEFHELAGEIRHLDRLLAEATKKAERLVDDHGDDARELTAWHLANYPIRPTSEFDAERIARVTSLYSVHEERNQASFAAHWQEYDAAEGA